jgi:hypothetical protein
MSGVPASPLQVARTVLSAFFGVRRKAEHDKLELKPAQIIIAGLIGAVVFVGTLLLLVNFILSRAGAA